MSREPYGILDEFSYLDDDDLEAWPNITIREGMLVQPSPGHKDYNLRFEDIGLVTKTHNEKYDVLWPDDSLEKNLSIYSLTRPVNKDRVDAYLKSGPHARGDDSHISLKDNMNENITQTSDASPESNGVQFHIGDLVMVQAGYSDIELASEYNYVTPGLVIEVMTHVVPPKYTVLWSDGAMTLYEDDLVLYDEH